MSNGTQTDFARLASSPSANSSYATVYPGVAQLLDPHLMLAPAVFDLAEVVDLVRE